MPRRSSERVEARRRARAAVQRAASEAERARSIASSVSPDADLEGDVQRCADEASKAHEHARDAARKCDNVAVVDPYSYADERRDATRGALQYARAAEAAADAAKLAADGAKWAANRANSAERELASYGADIGTTYRAWLRRGR